MNKSVILGVIRHLLTTFGGVLVAQGYTDENSFNEIVGGIVAIVGVAWSIIEKKKAQKMAGTPVAVLAFILGASLLMTGCATVAKDGPYNGDSVLYNADKSILTSYDILHSFVKWEYENRASLSQWPEIKQAADHVRANAEQWITSAQVLRDTYAAQPSRENREMLETSLRLLRAALSEATIYLNKNR